MRPESTAAASSPAPIVRPNGYRPKHYTVPFGLRIFIACKLAAVALLLFHRPIASLIVFFAPDPWFLAQFIVPTSRGFGPVVTRFTTDRREVWLTIDDGPDPATTPRVLSLLSAGGAKATFFLIGQKAERHPELVAEVLRQGHSVGNHTYRHASPFFWCGSAGMVAREIDRCDEALRQAGAETPRWFRPPVGIKNLFLHRALAQRGRDLVLWTARGYDSLSLDAAAVSKRIIRDIRPGTIILLHESGRPGSPRVDVIEQILAYLAREDYACVLPSVESLETRQA
jgi:peptidoglycan/xylan/chitin deacetylase (PgdA/CDA1 family)